MWIQETAVYLTATAIAIEKEVTSLFYSDYYSLSSSCTFGGISSSSSNASTHHGYSAWVWMTVIILGLYTVISLFTNAMACYQFIAAWSLISRTNRFDIELLRNHQRMFAERRNLMQHALQTQLYSEQQQEQSQLHFTTVASTTTAMDIDQDHHQYTTATQRLHHHGHHHDDGNDHETDPCCPICLMDFQSSDRVSSCKDTQNCRHLFHEECLNSWLDEHQSCPCCRFDILPTTSSSSSLSPPPSTPTRYFGF